MGLPSFFFFFRYMYIRHTEIEIFAAIASLSYIDCTTIKHSSLSDKV